MKSYRRFVKKQVLPRATCYKPARRFSFGTVYVIGGGRLLFVPVSNLYYAVSN